MRILILGIVLMCWFNIKAMAAINSTTNEQITWLQLMKVWRQQMKDCLKQKQTNNWMCLKIGSLQIFEKALDSDVINLYEGVSLIRQPSNSKLSANLSKDLQVSSWFHEASLILARTFNTHLLQINFEALTKKLMQVFDKRANVNETPRHKRQRYNMMMTMMFGVTALGAVLVPLGFQLLSIVSGKAILLAKMALLLASINGLKRVANSGIHYGLYHVPSEQLGGYYDRGDMHHPRTVLSSVNMEPPSLEFGIRK